jgi:hypothetical protein
MNAHRSLYSVVINQPRKIKKQSALCRKDIGGEFYKKHKSLVEDKDKC